jgi:hypothetical protein
MVRPNSTRSKQPKPKLDRETFSTSREMDFFSEKKLINQTGHDVADWPLVVVKELIDNALDACEESGVAPVIDVVADATSISVSDNGPGLPEATLEAQLDFAVRASSREAYVSPCRGAQGNALKTIVPMPWVVDPDHGRLVVEAHGKHHVVTCGVNPISQRPVIQRDVADLPKCKKLQSGNGAKKQAFSGTLVRLEWQQREGPEWPFDSILPVEDDWFSAQFRRLVEGFALFNLHATFRLSWFGEQTCRKCTDPMWAKWKPSDPTSAH